MKKINFVQICLKQVKSITIEPLLFMIAFSLSLIGGAQVTTNLLIWKICHVELHYNENVCGNLSLEANTVAEQVLISSTFYEQLYHTKKCFALLVCTSSFCLYLFIYLKTSKHTRQNNKTTTK